MGSRHPFYFVPDEVRSFDVANYALAAVALNQVENTDRTEDVLEFLMSIKDASVAVHLHPESTNKVLVLCQSTKSQASVAGSTGAALHAVNAIIK